jgi:hypothetical protein
VETKYNRVKQKMEPENFSGRLADIKGLKETGAKRRGWSI